MAFTTEAIHKRNSWNSVRYTSMFVVLSHIPLPT